MKSQGASLLDGFSEADIDDLQDKNARPSPLGIVVFGVLLAFGLSGWMGNHQEPISIKAEAVDVTVQTPLVMRTGSIFETSIEVVASQPIKNLVIGASARLWQGVTINAMAPAAEKESYDDDTFRFYYGELDKGKTFVLKIDGQVNPAFFGVNRGHVSVFDGESELASVPIAMRVLP